MERAHGKAEITFQQWRVRPSCGKVGEPIRVGGLLPGSDADGSNRPEPDCWKWLDSSNRSELEIICDNSECCSEPAWTLRSGAAALALFHIRLAMARICLRGVVGLGGKRSFD